MPRIVALVVAAFALVSAVAASGQPVPPKIARIGFLQATTPQNNTSPFLEDFRQGLRELGYVEGRNVVIEPRWAEGRLDRLPVLAQELVQLQPDVIVAINSPSVLALKQATRTIPIVTPLSSDPVADGLVVSLARPGGNITGFSQMAPDMAAKRLELLKQVFPGVSRPIAVLWNPDYVGMVARFRQTERLAPSVGMDVKSIEVRNTGELERRLDELQRQRPDALILLIDPLTLSQRVRIVEFAAEMRLPAIYENSQFVDAGGLMSYGADVDDLVRRSAGYVDKILRGEKPANLPIEQPTKFELVINLKTARAMGVTIPESVLLRADRVVR